MALQEKQTSDWIVRAQIEAIQHVHALESLHKPLPNPNKEIAVDKTLVSFFEPYKQVLDSVFEEVQGSGWQVLDLGVSQRSGEEYLDRNTLFELKQKYPTAGISFNLNEVKETETAKKMRPAAQAWTIFTEDLNELAQIEMTPMEHEVKGFVGVKLSIKYAGITVNTNEPKLSHFFLEAANAQELTNQTAFIQNSLTEILIYREKMQVLMKEENMGLRKYAFSHFEKEEREAKYHSKLQALLTREIMESQGITPLELYRRLLVYEADYSALRRELFSLKKNLSVVYKNGKFYANNPQE